MYPLSRLFSRAYHRSAIIERWHRNADVIDNFKKFTVDESNDRTLSNGAFIQMSPNFFQNKRYSNLNDSEITRFNVSLCSAFERNNHVKAMQMFNCLVQSDHMLSPNMASYEIMIKGLCTKAISEASNKAINLGLVYLPNACTKAISLLNQMEEEGMEVHLDSYYWILKTFYVYNRFSEWENLWKKIESKGIKHRVPTYLARMEVLISQCKIPEAHQLLEEMTANQLKPFPCCYNILIKAYVNVGQLDKAKRVHQDMLESGCNEDMYTIMLLIQPLCDKGDFDFALQLITNYMSCISALFSHLNPLVQMVVDGLMEESKVDEAKKLVQLANSKMHSSAKIQLKHPSKEL